MTRVKLLAIGTVLVLSGSAVAADPTPKFFNPAQEARIKTIETRLDTLENKLAQVPPARPMPRPVPNPKAGPAVNAVGAVVEAAPAGQEWVKAGTLDSDSPWELRPVTAAPAPAFATPVRNVLYRTLAPGVCVGGNCR